VTTDYRAHLLEQLACYDVPRHLRTGLLEYLSARRPTGDFLKAVLSNDLKDAALRADAFNEQRLVDIVRFLAHCAPATSWGSPAVVEAWLADPDPVPEIFE
jgi:hypothetical protein